MVVEEFEVGLEECVDLFKGLLFEIRLSHFFGIDSSNIILHRVILFI